MKKSLIKFRKLTSAFFVIFVFAQLNFAGAPEIIFKALEDEMARSLSQLKLNSFDKPYFVEYGINDVEIYRVEAKFGAIVDADSNRSRLGSIQLRIGSYDFDNTNLFAGGGFERQFPLVIDDDYDAIRHDLWLATDNAYKGSIEQFTSKKAYLQNNPVESKQPDWSRQQPTISISKPADLAFDKGKWEKIARNLSAVFRKYPQVTSSSVTFYVRTENRYLVNSEGTKILEPVQLISMNIYASSRTSDNLNLTPSRHIFARTFEQMPDEASMTATAEKLAQELTAVRNAPIFDETYIGPALFTDRAAIQLFIQLLAPNLGVERNSLASSDEKEGELSERLNRRILPPSISIVDDPTIEKIGNYAVVGSYKFDEEGVRPKPLVIVENGILKNLLSTRVPTKLIPQSNGRARMGSSPFISNLIVEAKNGKSFEELKKELIELCRSQSLPYGILFREIDSTFSPSGGSLASPILAYRVYVADGREELVRNLAIDQFPVRELRQILSVGSDKFTLNHLYGNGQIGSGAPYSVTAPSILMDEIVLRKDTSTKSKPIIITNPFFDKK